MCVSTRESVYMCVTRVRLSGKSQGQENRDPSVRGGEVTTMVIRGGVVKRRTHVNGSPVIRQSGLEGWRTELLLVVKRVILYELHTNLK